MSPSIPVSSHNRAGANAPTSLPSGLGAGGRGKEKAPCRYLHFEVDWDEADENKSAAAAMSAYKKVNTKKETKKPFRLGIGQGPTGKITDMVGDCVTVVHICVLTSQSGPTSMDQL
jgi:mRNA (2'-O-methyladenosine-N6-)-methyltransferase